MSTALILRTQYFIVLLICLIINIFEVMVHSVSIADVDFQEVGLDIVWEIMAPVGASTGQRQPATTQFDIGPISIINKC